MTKDLLIDPAIVRRPGTLEIAPIPANAYRATLAQEKKRFGTDALVDAARDMVLVREFELMLDAIKKSGSYRGVEYVHAGPAHLSIGQEAAAVGQAFGLGLDDRVFGSHRSHGEVIAKGLSAIRAGEVGAVLDDMRAWNEGATWAVSERRMPGADDRARAESFLFYGMAAETFGRSTGFNRGLGGSMHAFFPPLGIFPNNAIVGGSAPMATGAALSNRLRRQPGIVVASFGDAATGTGPVWESLNFASMAQLNTLMDEEHRGGLPIVFFVVNNFYGMGGQTIGETMAFDRLARIGAGVNAQNMHAQTVDGTNPLAVADAMATARGILERGEGPVLLDVQTYRQSGHSPSDASSYRTPEEMELWSSVDPIASYYEHLGALTPRSLQDQHKAEAEELVTAALRAAIDPDASPRLSLRTDPRVMAGITFADTEIDLADATPGDTTGPLEETSRAVALARKSRVGVVDGATLGGAKAITFRDALFEAIAAHAVADDRVAFWGEENRDWDGAFGVYRGMTELLPRHRLFNSPISEAAIVGSAVGFSLAGGRPVVELMYADFIGRAGDEIFNQLAKWPAMSGGLVRTPAVLRVSVGSKYGAQHSQDWSSMVAGIPGLKVVFPATPRDAKGLMASALSSNDPVVFFESQRLYDIVETVHADGVPAEYYRTPLGEPAVVREGTDVTILTVGATLYRALDAATALQEKYGLSAEVIDARTLVPFDYDRVLESVAKTGRLVIASDACLRGSWAQGVASRVQLEAFDDLDAPVVTLGARNWIAPPAELEWDYFVTAADILDAIHARVVPLPGHQVQDGPGAEGTLEEARLGL